MVDRENIYLKWRNVSTSKTGINSKGEEIVGDGVTKDAFFLNTELKKRYLLQSPFLNLWWRREIIIIIQKEFVQYQVFPITTSLKASSIFCQSMLGNMIVTAEAQLYDLLLSRCAMSRLLLFICMSALFMFCIFRLFVLLSYGFLLSSLKARWRRSVVSRDLFICLYLFYFISLLFINLFYDLVIIYFTIGRIKVCGSYM